MQPSKSHLTKRLAAIAVLLIASAVLVACGGSSSKTSSTTTTNASATAPAGGGGPAGARGGRFSALRECLKKEGVTLPTGPSGSARPKGGGGFLGGGGQRALPSGVSRSKFDAAMKKCGGASFRDFKAGARLNTPAFKQSLEKFAACMREKGIKVPAPNTSGKGPIFNTKGLDTSSATFRAAQQKCSSLLRTGKPAAGAGGPGGAGAPPSPAG